MRSISCLLLLVAVVHGFSSSSSLHHHATIQQRHYPPITTVLSMSRGQSGFQFRTVIYDDEEEEEEELVDVPVFKINGDAAAHDTTKEVVKPATTNTSDKKIQLRLDGLEPYVLVSAITATASFDVVTGGNLFGNSPIFAPNDSFWDDVLRATLLVTNTSSSCLGLYALGIFSFCIMYSKAALAREDEMSHTVYETFFKFTASYRYKGYQAFLWSLILFVLDLFLFAIAYLPENVRPFAFLGSAPIIYTCWADWQAIVKEAGIIYAPLDQIKSQMENKVNGDDDN